MNNRADQAFEPNGAIRMARSPTDEGGFVRTLSRTVFGFAALVLILLALGLILQGSYYAAVAIWEPGVQSKTALLGGIGYVIIAIAVFDVAKFLVEEEVVQSREKQTASEARLTLTKFISTIAIAVFLEALVMVFQVSTERISDILYPTFLLVAGTLLVLGLGVFQRLSAEVEQRVENDEPSTERRGDQA